MPAFDPLQHAPPDTTPLRVLVTTPSAHAAIARRARQDGHAIRMEGLASAPLVERVVRQPASYDLVQLEYWMVREVLPAGVLQGLPRSRLAHGHLIEPLFTAGTVGGDPVTLQGTAPHRVQFLNAGDARYFGDADGEYLSLAPTICNSDTLGWRVDRCERPVTSWADLLAPDFRGRTALSAVASVSIVEAALAVEAAGLVSYANKGDLTRAEIDRTLSALHPFAAAGQFHGCWRSYEESVAWMLHGPVALQSLWPPAVSALLATGVPLRYRPLREGARGWAGGFALAAHLRGARLDAALDYINWYQSGWVGAFLTRQGYYSAVPTTARQYLTTAEWSYWYEGAAAAVPMADPAGRTVADPGSRREGGSYAERMGRIACWSSRMTEHDYLVSTWNAFRREHCLYTKE